MSIGDNLPKVALVDADEISRFRGRELADAFLSRRRERPLLMRL
jgi:hypothetical protein